MPAAPAPDQAPPPRGLAVRLMAVALILVGTFDMMLSWRGSLQIDGFYVILFTSGVVLYAIGSVLKSRGPSQSDDYQSNKN